MSGQYGPMDQHSEQQMKKPGEDLSHYIAVLRRYWWLIAVAAVLSGTVTWWLDHRRLPEYQAEALLQQRLEQPITTVGFGASMRGTDFGSHLDIIRSTAVMIPVVRSLGLQLRLTDRKNVRSRVFFAIDVTPNPPRGEYSIHRSAETYVLSDATDGSVIATAVAGQILEGPGFQFTVSETDLLDEPVSFTIRDIDTAVDRLVRKVQVEQGNGIDLIWIRYVSPDAQLAVRVANGVGEAYQRHRADTERLAAQRRREAVASQLLQVNDSLQVAGRSLLDYQERQRLQDPSVEGNALLGEMLRSDSELRDLRLQQRLLQRVVAGLESGSDVKAALEQVISLGGDGVAPRAGTLIQRLETLELEREALTAGTFGRTASDPAVEALDSQIRITRDEMQRVVEQSLEILDSRIRSAQSRYNDLQTRSGELPVRSAEFGRLQQRVDAVQTIFNQLVNSFYEAMIAEEVEAGDIDIIAPAPLPVRPLPARTKFRMLVAVLAGMLVGSVGALAMEQLDSSIRDPEQAQRIAHVDVIGVIPAVRSLSGDSVEAALGKEAFRSIRTHLRFAPVDELTMLVVTSAVPREGKTTVAVNLALTLMEQGARTLLVDSDIRRPQVHRTFQTASAPGLSDVLQGSAKLEQAIRPAEQHPQLHILPAGSATLAPTELIGGPAFEETCTRLRSMYDTVVIDTAPLLAVTDALLAAVLADGVILVARANKTDASALENAVQQLRRVHAKLLGIILNDVDARRPGSGYSYHYYPSESAEHRAEAGGKRFLLRPKRPSGD